MPTSINIRLCMWFYMTGLHIMDFNDFDLNFRDNGRFLELSLTQWKIPLPKQ